MLSLESGEAIFVHRDVVTLPPTIQARPSVSDGWAESQWQALSYLWWPVPGWPLCWPPPTRAWTSDPPPPAASPLSSSHSDNLMTCVHFTILSACGHQAKYSLKTETIAIHLCFPTSWCVTASSNKPQGTRPVSRSVVWITDIFGVNSEQEIFSSQQWCYWWQEAVQHGTSQCPAWVTPLRWPDSWLTPGLFRARYN